MNKSLKRNQRRSHHGNRRRRTLGGLSGAPLSYQLANDWSSKMSMGQGGDYLKYHVGQHGGVLSGTPLHAVSEPLIPSGARMAAHVGGIDQAIAQTRGMSDQAGGRRKRSKRSKHSKRSKRSKRLSHARRSRRSRRSRQTRRRGGSHEYAPYPSQGMLLSSPSDYSKAGLSREWVGLETEASQARSQL